MGRGADARVASSRRTSPSATVHPTLVEAFRALEETGAAWALVRGADDLASPAGDVDLLIEEGAGQAAAALTGAGFVELGVRGHGSHRFLFHYDPAPGTWTRLDLVTRVEFGRYQQLRTGLATGCLARRRPDGGVWRLSPDDEAWLLLLHVVLDKRGIRPARREVAQHAVATAAHTDPIARDLDRRLGPGTAERVRRAFGTGGDGDLRALATELTRRWVRRSPVGTASAWVGNRVLRHLDIPASARLPGPVVAVVGPDGAGKSTLSNAVREWYPGPSRPVYMGIWQSGPWDPVLQQLPGGRLAQRLLRAVRSSLSVRLHRRLGRLVVLDRFARDAVLPGAEDLSIGGRIVSSALLRFAPQPDLVLVLDAPGEVMFARKGEHSVEVLENRRQAYLELAVGSPTTVVLDATRPADEVAHHAVAALWRALLERNGLAAPDEPAEGPR